MRILYVARHDAHGNDDEGAVTHALTELGHQVYRLQEPPQGYADLRRTYDLCLFHKWYDPVKLNVIECPKVFWHFDRIEDPDPSLAKRNEARKAWMSAILPLVDLGFCTDGDWVSQDTSGKLNWLTQGADGRRVGCVGASSASVPLLLMAETVKCGDRRQSFVAEVVGRYGLTLTHVPRGVHGQELASLIATAQIVLAPDAPASDRYWSNRVYLTLGFGGFLLHPFCRELAHHYDEGKELVCYGDRDHLHYLIEKYMLRPGERRQIAQAGLERTRSQHLYRHRVEELLGICKERRLI